MTNAPCKNCSEIARNADRIVKSLKELDANTSGIVNNTKEIDGDVKNILNSCDTENRQSTGLVSSIFGYFVGSTQDSNQIRSNKIELDCYGNKLKNANDVLQHNEQIVIQHLNDGTQEAIKCLPSLILKDCDSKGLADLNSPKGLLNFMIDTKKSIIGIKAFCESTENLLSTKINELEVQLTSEMKTDQVPNHFLGSASPSIKAAFSKLNFVSNGTSMCKLLNTKEVSFFIVGLIFGTSLSFLYSITIVRSEMNVYRKQKTNKVINFGKIHEESNSRKDNEEAKTTSVIKNRTKSQHSNGQKVNDLANNNIMIKPVDVEIDHRRKVAEEILDIDVEV